MTLRLAVCGAMGALRLIELSWSRRHLSGASSTEGRWSRETYPFIIIVHAVALLGTAFGGSSKATAFWLALLFAVQPLRFWSLLTLGERWNTRGAVADDLSVETGGPYRYIRHPNYLVVIVELAALPFAFGRVGLGVLVSLANALLLTIRIKEEEELLARSPEWRAHFADKQRFIPDVF